MARCCFCGGYIKAGTGNIHHKWFPRKKYKRTTKGKEQYPAHVACHNEFNMFMTYICHAKLPCTGCKYNHICCYAK